MSTPSLLDGLRVVEIASDHTALAGKMLADYGAEVIVVEPPGGHASRRYEPFVADEPDPERSLYWWHFNTSKLGVTIDVEEDPETLRRLVATADIVLDGDTGRQWAARGIDVAALLEELPRLIWVSVTPFGRDDPRSLDPAVDLTLLAEGGPVWSCGYDDHELPPVRPGGGHAYNTGAIWAVQSALAAVLSRDATGQGQLIDVSLFAAADVTTEGGSFWWLVAGGTVQRQTARLAAVSPTMSTLVQSADGRPVQTGVPPRSPRQFRQLLGWLRDAGLYDAFEDIALLEMAAEADDVGFHAIGDDVLVTEMIGAGREALNFLAASLSAYDFFLSGQEHGIAVGMIYAPEEVVADPHLIERGFPVLVWHEDLGREVVYPGAPFKADAAPWRISRRAPRIGEHNSLLSELPAAAVYDAETRPPASTEGEAT